MPSPRFLAVSAPKAEWQDRLLQLAQAPATHADRAQASVAALARTLPGAPEVPEVPPVRVPRPPLRPGATEVSEHIAEHLRVVAAGLTELLQDRMDWLERSLQEVVERSLASALAQAQGGAPGAEAPGPREAAATAESELRHGSARGDGSETLPRGQDSIDVASLFQDPQKQPHTSTEDSAVASVSIFDADKEGHVLWPLWRGDVACSDDNNLDIGVCIRLREMRKVKEILTRDASGANFSPRDPTCYIYFSGWVRHPTSTPIMMWLMVAPFLILYDVILIPMNAMPLPDLDAFHLMYLFCAIYWTLDILRLFFTGYEDGIKVEMRLNHIIVRYLKTWFALDFVSVLMDWIFIAMGVTGIFNKFWRTNRAMKSFRILRIFRLVRIMKYATQYRQVYDRLHSVQTLLFLKSLLVFLGVMLFLHYNGCYWYSLGDEYLILDEVTGHQKDTWISVREIEDDNVIDIYIAAIQWSLAQGGFSSTDIYPTNTFEHVYAVFTGFLWLVIVSLCISMYNKWLLEFRDANRDFEKGVIDLRAHLYQHGVSRGLMYKILGCYRATYRSQRRQTHEQDVEFMKNLPSTLMISLHKEVHLPTLTGHAFFRVLGRMDSEFLTAVSHMAMQQQHISCGEPAFCEGEAARHMLCISSGELDYYSVCADRNSLVRRHIVAGDWACEPALWLQWHHRGRLVATTSVEIILINVVSVHAIAEECEKHGANLDETRQFVADVVAHFRTRNPNSDLWDDVDTIGRIEEAHFASPRLQRRGESSPFRSFQLW